MSKKILKGDPQYPLFLAKYLNTKEGMAFALSVVSQLIDGFDVNHKGWIEATHIDDTKPITLDME